MKLYATVESERATKGQGGNKYLVVILKVGSTGDSKKVGEITLTPDGDGYRILHRIGLNERASEIYLNENGERKGEQQKGE